MFALQLPCGSQWKVASSVWLEPTYLAHVQRVLKASHPALIWLMVVWILYLLNILHAFSISNICLESPLKPIRSVPIIFLYSAFSSLRSRPCHSEVPYSPLQIREGNCGPFLERPDNFSGWKANFEIKTRWIVTQFLAHNPVNFASVTIISLYHFQNYWNFDLECKHGKHHTAFQARKVKPGLPPIPPGLLLGRMRTCAAGN